MTRAALEALEQSDAVPALTTIKELADRAAGQYLAGEPALFAEVTLRLCQLVPPEAYDGGEATRLRDDIALQALSQQASLPVELTAQLLLELSAPPRTVVAAGAAGWSDPRRELADLWVHTVCRAERLAADPPALPRSNLRPPAGVDLPAGVSPEAIQDPGQRSIYEASIADEVAVGRRYRSFVVVRPLIPALVEGATAFLASMYAIPPASEDEVRAVVDHNGCHSERRQQLLEAALGSTGEPDRAP